MRKRFLQLSITVALATGLGNAVYADAAGFRDSYAPVRVPSKPSAPAFTKKIVETENGYGLPNGRSVFGDYPEHAVVSFLCSPCFDPRYGLWMNPEAEGFVVVHTRAVKYYRKSMKPGGEGWKVSDGKDPDLVDRSDAGSAADSERNRVKKLVEVYTRQIDRELGERICRVWRKRMFGENWNASSGTMLDGVDMDFGTTDEFGRSVVKDGSNPEIGEGSADLAQLAKALAAYARTAKTSWLLRELAIANCETERWSPAPEKLKTHPLANLEGDALIVAILKFHEEQEKVWRAAEAAAFGRSVLRGREQAFREYSRMLADFFRREAQQRAKIELLKADAAKSPATTDLKREAQANEIRVNQMLLENLHGRIGSSASIYQRLALAEDLPPDDPELDSDGL